MSVGLSVSVRGSVPTPSFTRPLSDANRRIAKFAHADARLNVARHTRSGETVRELRAVPLGSKGVEMRDAAPQAWFLEHGSKPRVIWPRPEREAAAKAEYARAKATYERTGVWPRGARRSPHAFLRFEGSDGQPIFAREVNHPGTKADPFMAPAITENAGLWERMYTDSVMRELERG